ncbi:hypothetical protein [Psychromonas aquimarina]|uniref:hypothetical protein n=1 Tax=Psychromonas aquimarina TaxID=444919 RepID=UPI000419D6C7|nr:hypothetical protein [Psychromonas aquimarina]
MQPFSLLHWQSLTEEAQKNFRNGQYNKAQLLYKLALQEAQKLIDDLQLSATYEHSAHLYMRACYNLARSYQHQENRQKTFYYLNLAHVQIQKFADCEQLSNLTRTYSLKVLDGTLVSLLEYFQVHKEENWKKQSDALIAEHVDFMQKHNNKNLPKDLQHKNPTQRSEIQHLVIH